MERFRATCNHFFSRWRVIGVFGCAWMWAAAAYAQTPPAVDTSIHYTHYHDFVEPQALNLAEFRSKVGYPRLAREAEITGTVVLRLLIDDSGQVKDVQVERSPHPILSQAVMAHVHELRFAPGTLHGVPSSFRVHMPFHFRYFSPSRSGLPFFPSTGDCLRSLADIDDWIKAGLSDSVTAIDLPAQALTEFPAKILQFPKLQLLNLSGNPLDSLPASIAQLQHLKLLAVSDMQLQSLPEWLWSLPELRYVIVKGNRFSKETRHLLVRHHRAVLYPRDPRGNIIFQ